jgi:hypothetical protein
MAHVVILVCIQMQVQAVLCCIYSMIFNIIFKIKHKLYIATGLAFPRTVKNYGSTRFCC